MNRKTIRVSKFFRLHFPLSIFILILLIGGCRQNAENASTTSSSANIIPIGDNNNDGTPDGWHLLGSPADRGDYELSLDTTTGYTDEISLLLKTNKNTADGGYAIATRKLTSINQYEGKRVRLSGYIKTEDVSEQAFLWFRVDGVGRDNILAFDNMADRAPTGTADWQRFDLVLDIPDDVAIARVHYGFILAGSGKAWLDDVQLDIVGEEVPVTDIVPAIQATDEAE